MKPSRTLLILLCIALCNAVAAQDLDKSFRISVFSGVMNYQGDVKPDNFTIEHSNFAGGITVRKPFNNLVSLRVGVNVGTITAADRWNRDDLKPRNLDFTTTIKEAYLGLEVSVLDINRTRFAPYFYAGIAVFNFNPWTRDKNGNKVYLQPLGTEGQGLSIYPDRKPYKLTQICIPFGGGARFMVTDGINVGFEINQRKSFTDYIDDVSSIYVDRDALLQEKGILAVELAYRAGELPGGRPLFPTSGEKRGTPTEMDWYYFFGFTLETKLSKLGSLFNFRRSSYDQKCPRSVLY